MKCDQFKQILLEEPGCTDKDFQKHRQDCEDCEQAYQEAQQFEKLLTDAFDLEIPDDLQSDLIEQSRKPAFWWTKPGWRFAGSFSILALVAISAVLINAQNSVLDLSDEIFAHVDNEQWTFNNQAILPSESTERLFKQFDINYRQALREVTFAEPCKIDGEMGLHLVSKGKAGAVTYLIMPEKTVSATVSIQNGQYKGKIYPTDFGSFAVVGSHTESIEMAAEHLRMSMLNKTEVF